MRGNTLQKAAMVRDGVKRLTHTLAAANVTVTQQGAEPSSTFNASGRVKTINIPVIPENPSPEFLEAIHGYLDMQAAKSLFTNKSRKLIDLEGDSSESSKKYLNATDIIENARIENEMGKRFQGSRSNFERSAEFIANQHLQPMLDDMDYEGDVTSLSEGQAKALRSKLIQTYISALGGNAASQRFLDKNGLNDLFAGIQKDMPNLSEEIKRLNNTEGSFDLAKKIVDYVESQRQPPGEGDGSDKPQKGGQKSNDQNKSKSKEDKPENKGEKEKGEGSKGDSEDGDTENSDNQEQQDSQDSEDSSDEDEGEGDAEGGDESGDSENESEGDAEGGDESGDSENESEGDEGSIGEGPRYSAIGSSMEFKEAESFSKILETEITHRLTGAFSSETQVDFTRDYDRIEPLKPSARYDVREMETEVHKLAGPLQKELQRIIVARSMSYNVPGHRSGRLNGPSLHRLMAHDDRVFKRRHIGQTNKVAVSLVVDCSGSMSSGRPSKMKMALMSAWAFSEVLHRLKIPHEILGFTTGGFRHIQGFNSHDYHEGVRNMAATLKLPVGNIRSTPIWMPIFKSFNENFSNTTKQRLVAFEEECNMSGNDDATALIYAGERLLTRTETRKMMIVFSDGNPAESGVDCRVLCNSTKQNVKKLEAAGIETVGIGICDESVKLYYPRNFTIRKVSELPKKVMKELQRILTEEPKE